jgi:hypothetical protein
VDRVAKDSAGQAVVPEDPPAKRASGIAFPKLRTKLKGKDKQAGSVSPAEEVPDVEKGNSPSSKVKTWVNRLTRPRAKSSGAAMEQPNRQRQEFVGGAALKRIKENNHSTGSLDNRSASMREVAMARASHFQADEGGESSAARRPISGDGRHDDTESDDAPSIVRSVSSLSTDDNRSAEVKGEVGGALSPPPPVRGSPLGRDSPVKESKFTEMMD